MTRGVSLAKAYLQDDKMKAVPFDAPTCHDAGASARHWVTLSEASGAAAKGVPNELPETAAATLAGRGRENV